MTIEIITREDFLQFKEEVLTEIRSMRPERQPSFPWMKARELKKILSISTGTLQTLRLNGTLPFTKVGGIIYYKKEDIDHMMNTAKSDNDLTLPKKDRSQKNPSLK